MNRFILYFRHWQPHERISSNGILPSNNFVKQQKSFKNLQNHRPAMKLRCIFHAQFDMQHIQIAQNSLSGCLIPPSPPSPPSNSPAA